MAPVPVVVVVDDFSMAWGGSGIMAAVEGEASEEDVGSSAMRGGSVVEEGEGEGMGPKLVLELADGLVELVVTPAPSLAEEVRLTEGLAELAGPAATAATAASAMMCIIRTGCQTMKHAQRR